MLACNLGLALLAAAIPPDLPRFVHRGLALDYRGLRYNPCDDIIVPTVLRMDEHVERPLGRYYLHCAPHNAPGGICLAYADRLDGPWTEYAGNPIIGREWAPHYAVSHVSGPHMLWMADEQRYFLYFHGENDVTRIASTRDGRHFEYEGVAFDSKTFEDINEASYARVFRYGLPGRDNKYIALLMGNNRGTRRIYLAWSKDGRRWESRPKALLSPPDGTNQVAQAWLLPWRGKQYLVYHAHQTADFQVADLHINEVDANLETVAHRGVLYDHTTGGPDNVAQMSPCLIEEDGKLYMFTNIGPRLHQKIALAVAEPSTKP